MIIEVSEENVQEINFKNVFPYNEHISFENFVIDAENGFLARIYIGKQWCCMYHNKNVSNKTRIRSANGISKDFSGMTVP